MAKLAQFLLAEESQLKMQNILNRFSNDAIMFAKLKEAVYKHSNLMYEEVNKPESTSNRARETWKITDIPEGEKRIHLLR